MSNITYNIQKKKNNKNNLLDDLYKSESSYQQLIDKALLSYNNKYLKKNINKEDHNKKDIDFLKEGIEIDKKDSIVDNMNIDNGMEEKCLDSMEDLNMIMKSCNNLKSIQKLIQRLNETNSKIEENISFLKFYKSIIHEQISYQKDLQKRITNDYKILMRTINKLYELKHHKPVIKNRGFGKPVKVKSELCEFMGINEDNLISRTEFTKFLAKYIKENNLINHSNGSIIIDENLKKIINIGTDYNFDENPITLFNIQKYIGHLFN